MNMPHCGRRSPIEEHPAERCSSVTSGYYGITITRSYTGNTPAEKVGRLTSETTAINGTNAGTQCRSL